MGDKSVILDYAAGQRRLDSRPEAVTSNIPRPTIPTAYPAEEPGPPLTVLMVNYVVIPVLMTIGSLAFLYFAVLRQGHSSPW